MNNQNLESVSKFFKTGFTKSALYMLTQVLENNPDDEIALLLRYYCIEDDSRKSEIIDHVLKINPRNVEANNLKNGVINGVETYLSTINRNDLTPNIQKNYTVTKTNFPLPDYAKENVKKAVQSQRTKLKPDANPMKTNGVKFKSQKKSGTSKGINNERTKRIDETNNQLNVNSYITTTSEGINQAARLDTGMFGNVIIVDGVKFNPYVGPPCLQFKKDWDESECEFCEYFSPRDCLLKYDEYLAEDLSRFTIIQEERKAAHIKRSKIVSQIIHNELIKHGRPLHYSMIYKIINGRYPKFHLSEKSIYHFITLHPELFERIEDGVYQAKKKNEDY